MNALVLGHPQLTDAVLQWVSTDAELLLVLRLVSKGTKELTDAFIVDVAVEYIIGESFHLDWMEMSGTLRILWTTSPPLALVPSFVDRVVGLLGPSLDFSPSEIESLPDFRRSQITAAWSRFGASIADVVEGSATVFGTDPDRCLTEQDCYKMALRIKPDFDQAWVGLSAICDDDEEIEVDGFEEPFDCLRLLQQAIGCNPKCELAWGNIASGLYDREWDDDAVCMFDRSGWTAQECCGQRLVCMDGFDDAWKPFARKKGWKEDVTIGKDVLSDEQIITFLLHCLSNRLLNRYKLIDTLKDFGLDSNRKESADAFRLLSDLLVSAVDPEELRQLFDLFGNLVDEVYEDISAEFNAWGAIENAFLAENAPLRPALLSALQHGQRAAYGWNAISLVCSLSESNDEWRHACFRLGYFPPIITALEPTARKSVFSEIIRLIGCFYTQDSDTACPIVTALEEEHGMDVRLVNALVYLVLDRQLGIDTNVTFECLVESIGAYLEYHFQLEFGHRNLSEAKQENAKRHMARTVALRKVPRVLEALDVLKEYEFEGEETSEAIEDLLTTYHLRLEDANRTESSPAKKKKFKGKKVSKK